MIAVDFIKHYDEYSISQLRCSEIYAIVLLQRLGSYAANWKASVKCPQIFLLIQEMHESDKLACR